MALSGEVGGHAQSLPLRGLLTVDMSKQAQAHDASTAGEDCSGLAWDFWFKSGRSQRRRVQLSESPRTGRDHSGLPACSGVTAHPDSCILGLSFIELEPSGVPKPTQPGSTEKQANSGPELTKEQASPRGALHTHARRVSEPLQTFILWIWVSSLSQQN